ncbi:MAG: hypothetical protein GX285_07180, partial [Clostridiales bacterium]|nr:hypothetical protein [Clostridiales bacterium]
VDHLRIVRIGTSKGLCSFDSFSEQFSLHSDFNTYGNVELIYETSDNRLWLVFPYAIITLDYYQAKVNILAIYDGAPTFIDNIDKNTTYVMLEDSRGLLWFGTNHGLFCFRLSDNKFESNIIAETMANKTILTMLEDNSGILWVATRQGLWKLSMEDGVSIEYGIEDGLINDMFCSSAVYKAGDGELFFGTVGGLISFYPDKVMSNNTVGEVIINGFNLLEEKITFNKPVEEITEIKLPYSNNSFIIDFVALIYDSPTNIQYAYKLDGFDDDWNYCDYKSNSTKYTNLGSGEYDFFVIALNSEGYLSSSPASLRIYIATPLWEQWWFILSIVLFILLMVFLFIQIRTRTLRKYAFMLESNVEERSRQLAQKTKQLEKELKNRAKFTRALVHELKTPLTSLQLTNDILTQFAVQEPFLDLAVLINKDVISLSNRINELLDLSRGEISLLKLRRENTALGELFETLRRDFELLAKSEGKILQFDIQDNLPEAFIDKERIIQVINNLIDNAFKYTFREGEIL